MLTILMILIIVLSNAAGDVFLTKGMKQVGDISVLSPFEIFRTMRRIFGNPNFISGIACLTLSFFSFLTVLSWADLSFVIPATAIYYVVTVLGAKFLLGERIDLMRWAGTLLVCLGVALVCLPEDQAVSVPAILDAVRIFFFILAVASAIYYLISIIAAERFFSKPPASLPGEFRPVSILIPLCGADFHAYRNYAALCRQDYPEFEIVFGVGASQDSSIPVIARLRADFPQTPIKLVISAGKIGPNPKVNTLNNMLSQAVYDTLILLDSDIRVGQDFMKKIVAELPANGEGLVTCLYRAAEAPGIPSKLEAAGISADFAPGVLVAELAGGVSFAFGAAILLSRKTLDSIGGFAAVAPYLADDYMLGNLVRKAGFPVKLSSYVVETVLPKMSMCEFLRHQVRWARGIRACAPLGHTGSIVQNGSVLGFLYFVASGFSGFGLCVFSILAALRLAVAWLVGVRRLGDDILRHNLLLAFLRDFFSFFIWMAALTGRRVVWRGLVFELEDDGKITPAKIPCCDSQPVAQ
jgi:ceramide glucosyltransferase